MMNAIIKRSLYTTAKSLGATKSPLATLRKKTGYSISQCKKALELHDQNIKEAEAYLKKKALEEGWSKANSLQGRNASQGLLGVMIRNQSGVIIELNCETDFVARIDKFQYLLKDVVESTALFVDEGTPEVNEPSIIKYSTEELIGLKSVQESSKTLGDVIALSIGKISENIQLTRGVGFKIPKEGDIKISANTHPSAPLGFNMNKLMFGKYASLLAYTRTNSLMPIPEGLDEVSFSRQLCQHIIGMNPTRIGSLNDEEKPIDDKDIPLDEVGEKPIIVDTRMVHQKFLLDDEITVGELLTNTGFSLHDFVRFELGETVK